MKKIFPVLAILTAGLLSYALYQALVVAPTDQMQGEVYRIIYYHVPSASVAFLFFAISLVGSVGYLAFRRSRPARAPKRLVRYTSASYHSEEGCCGRSRCQRLKKWVRLEGDR